MAELALSLDDLPPSRRVVITQVLSEALWTERGLAQLYAAAAARRDLAPLQTGFAALAAAKVARVAALDGLVRALDPDAAPIGESPGDTATDGREAALARAFRGERALDVLYRELAALIGDPARFPALPALRVEAARHRALLRDLYVRYS